MTTVTLGVAGRNEMSKRFAAAMRGQAQGYGGRRGHFSVRCDPRRLHIAGTGRLNRRANLAR
ncbi:hypothetical protein PSAC2689_60354 [Paraburkholderia sacchari]